MKKTALCLVLSVVLLALLPGCAPLNTDGLADAAPDLIRRSQTLNEIYYGSGIPYDENGTPTGNYYPADKDYLAKVGFSTLDGLDAETEAVFSAAYCEAIRNSTGGAASEGIYARYISSQAEGRRDERETILVYKNDVRAPLPTVRFDFSALTITEVGRDYACVTLPIETDYPPDDTHPDPYTEKSDMTVRFVYEGGGWRIDTPTY